MTTDQQKTFMKWFKKLDFFLQNTCPFFSWLEPSGEMACLFSNCFYRIVQETLLLPPQFIFCFFCCCSELIELLNWLRYNEENTLPWAYKSFSCWNLDNHMVKLWFLLPKLGISPRTLSWEGTELLHSTFSALCQLVFMTLQVNMYFKRDWLLPPLRDVS